MDPEQAGFETRAFESPQVVKHDEVYVELKDAKELRPENQVLKAIEPMAPQRLVEEPYTDAKQFGEEPDNGTERGALAIGDRKRSSLKSSQEGSRDGLGANEDSVARELREARIAVELELEQEAM